MRFLLLLAAAVIAIFAGVAAMRLSSSTQPHAQQQTVAGQKVTTVDVLVARVPIAAGTTLTADMVDKQPWPENLVLAGFIVSDSPDANVIGKTARTAFQAHEPLIATSLAGSADSGFLAANLPAGMRAVTIATDAVSGVAGFVFPGDRVDIVFTHNVPQEIRASEAAAEDSKAPQASDRPGYAEVLAANVPVLAINLREASKDDANGAASSNSSTSPSSMTLQLSDMQAEKIRLAEKVGTLSVALRSASDRNNTSVAAPADLMSLTQLNLEAPSSPAAPSSDTVKVIRSGDFGGGR